MSTLADDVRRQSELVERIQLEIHLAHNRVFHVTAPSWEAALAALEARAQANTPAEPEPKQTDAFGAQWEPV